jgi:chromosome segregation ATPase
MYGLAQIYEENRYDVYDLLKLNRIAKDRGMEKQDIINVLEFVKYNQLRSIRWEAVNLRYQINNLETEKTQAIEHIFELKRKIRECEETLAQKRREIAQMDQQSRSDNTCNSDPVTYP